MKRVKYAAGALATIIVLVLAYGTLIEPRLILDEERHSVAIPELGDDWEGAEVAVLADLQVGMWWSNTEMAE